MPYGTDSLSRRWRPWARNFHSWSVASTTKAGVRARRHFEDSEKEHFLSQIAAAFRNDPQGLIQSASPGPSSGF